MPSLLSSSQGLLSRGHLSFRPWPFPQGRVGGLGDMPSRVHAPPLSTPLKALRTLNFSHKLPEPWCVPSQAPGGCREGHGCNLELQDPHRCT